MKILITGGAGFIGANFVKYWAKNHTSDELVILDKLTYAGNKANLNEAWDKFKFIEGDICDEKIVEEAMQGCDAVIHFAAESHVDRSINDPFIFTRSNVLGTHVLLETARKLGNIRFHHVSTDEVFGDIPLEETWKFRENTSYNPSSPYAASKAASDHLARSYFRTYQLPVTISNCSNNFGPLQHPEKFIPRSIIRLLNGDKIRLYTPGNQVRDWLHVEDHCRAIDLILQKGNLGETYCIGGMQQAITNKEVAEEILEILGLGKDKIEMVTDRPGHDVKYDIDWNKIHKDLGWQPQHEFKDWLRQTVEWYKDNQTWWENTAKESEAFYQTKNESLV